MFGGGGRDASRTGGEGTAATPATAAAATPPPPVAVPPRSAFLPSGGGGVGMIGGGSATATGGNYRGLFSSSGLYDDDDDDGVEENGEGTYYGNGAVDPRGLLSPSSPSRVSTISSAASPYSLFHRATAAEHRRRDTLGKLLLILTLTALLILIPTLVIHAARDLKTRPDLAAFYSAASFVVLTVVLSTHQIYQHLINWYAPDVQKYVVRILWMVPLYAVQSWLSLRFRKARIVIDALRDLYEAFVISSFVYYLIELLGGEDRLANEILREKEGHLGDHGWLLTKCCRMRRWSMGPEFLVRCKRGVLQYVVVRIGTTALTVVLEPMGLYGEGDFTWRRGYAYISFAINVSVMYALYCLVKLFRATADDLRNPINWRPMGKFLCIKGVVFFTWWQGVLIYYLRSQNVIGQIGNWDADDVANGLIDYLVCVEMLFFAVAHSFTFTYREYLPEAAAGAAGTAGLFGDSSLGNRGLKNGNGSSGGYERQRRRQRQRQQDRYIDGPFGVGGGGRGGGGGYGRVDDLDNVEDEGDDDDDSAYRPPVVRTLHVPLGFRDAFWSSTVPRETIHDIKRMSRADVSDEVAGREMSAMDLGSSPDGGGGGRGIGGGGGNGNGGGTVGMISLSSIQHAESI